jgi:hypothetical protein
MKKWQSDFTRYAMRTTFQIHLTRPMLEMLCAVADDVVWDRGVLGAARTTTLGAPDNFIASAGALEKRGLIEKKQHRAFENWSSVFEIKSFHILTPAGKAVVELLKVAGVFAEADNALERKARQKAI